jgi:hypothetical protein
MSDPIALPRGDGTQRAPELAQGNLGGEGDEADEDDVFDETSAA